MRPTGYAKASALFASSAGTCQDLNGLLLLSCPAQLSASLLPAAGLNTGQLPSQQQLACSCTEQLAHTVGLQLLAEAEEQRRIGLLPEAVRKEHAKAQGELARAQDAADRQRRQACLQPEPAHKHTRTSRLANVWAVDVWAVGVLPTAFAL